MSELLLFGSMTVSFVMISVCCVNGSKAENKLENALFSYFERLFTVLLAITLVGFIVMCHQDVMTTGFVEVIERLEALK